MDYSHQERLDRRMRPDYMDISEGRLGVDVHTAWAARNQFSQPDDDAISGYVQAFLRRGGIDCEKAERVAIGAATGPGVESVFSFMKQWAPLFN